MPKVKGYTGEQLWYGILLPILKQEGKGTVLFP